MCSNHLENDEEFDDDSLVITVDKGQSLLRIDKFLMDRIENVTRSRLQTGINLGSILVNDNRVKPNYKVKPLDVITLRIPKAEGYRGEVLPEDIPLNVVYEDDALMVINKPPDLVVHPGIGNYTGTLVNALAHYFSQNEMPLLQGNKPDRPWLVHRLDKDTSGLMIVAKTEKAMVHLAKQFFDHTILRTYHALVWGSPPDSGTVEGYIGRHVKNRMQMDNYTEMEMGKFAKTHFSKLEDLYYVSYVKCNLETGRTHQIRVHMKYIGHNLFNDERYNGNRILKGTIFSKYKQFVDNCFEIIPRHALHAKSLGFIHPITEEFMEFDSELPSDFSAVLNKWRNYHNTLKSKLDES